MHIKLHILNFISFKYQFFFITFLSSHTTSNVHRLSSCLENVKIKKLKCTILIIVSICTSNIEKYILHNRCISSYGWFLGLVGKIWGLCYFTYLQVLNCVEDNYFFRITTRWTKDTNTSIWEEMPLVF